MMFVTVTVRLGKEMKNNKKKRSQDQKGQLLFTTLHKMALECHK